MNIKNHLTRFLTSKTLKKSTQNIKFIFVTGGVVSSIGKGLAAASIGALLETRKLKVAMTKMDPYINVDPGTMSPFQHGEVFVTDDGAETDLDLGHYQRFTKANLSKKNSFTSGRVYDTVISKERRGDYLGGTVQVIPHITDQIKQNIKEASVGVDVSIVEVGGTVGDIESLPFLEAIRQFRNEVSRENSLFIHVTLIPFINAAGELKTKPTQHSVKELLSIGIQPDILICRSEMPLSVSMKEKISIFCNVEKDCVIDACDVSHIYKLPLVFHKQKVDQKIIDRLNISSHEADLSDWEGIVKVLENPKVSIKIGLIGKYIGLQDSYKSVYEALVHGGISNNARVEIFPIDSEELKTQDVLETLEKLHGVLIPGGFGDRGTEGKILAIKIAREQQIPLFGICLGMQLASIEFARNVLNFKDASSEELDPNSSHKIIHIMEKQKSVFQKGGTMRLGAYECKLKKETKTYKAYESKDIIFERHRHRYEFNNEFREIFEKEGFITSGDSPDGSLVEIMENISHPWFITCQFHPELKSRPTEVHPLFKSFVKACIDFKNSKE
jgi:CTP synthase